jgi:type IV pilus assembly protein PilM
VAEQQSIWKREISFRRRKPPPEAAEAAEADEAATATTTVAELLGGLERSPDGPEPLPEAEEPAKVRRRERRQAAKAERAERRRESRERKQTERRRRAKDKGWKRHESLVGLTVGSSQLAAAHVVNKGGAAKLVAVGREPVARGVVVAGEVREPEELAQALKALFRKHKLPKRAVRLGIANGRVGMRIFELAGIEDPKQLDNAVRFRAQETLPLPLDQAVLDYRILDERVDDEGQTVRSILLVVAYREPVERFVAACRKAGLKLVGVDLEAFGLLRALPDETPAEDARLVVCSIGHERTIVAVSDGESCEFTRVLDWGGAALDVAVARATDGTPSEAQPLRLRLSLLDERVLPGVDPDAVERARDAMRAEIRRLAQDVVAALRLYQEQPGSVGIGDIVLVGGTALVDGLVGELERLIGVRVRIGDPLAQVRLTKKVRQAAEEGAVELAGAIGLGLER